MDGKEVLSKIIGSIIDPLVLLMFSVGVFLFTWGLVVFLTQVDNPEGRKTGVQHMLWGIIGVFIMATVFGIINIVLDTFGLSDPTRINF